MRLFIATGIFHPESGGPATYLHHLLPEVVARGHQVTLLTFGDAPSADYPYTVIRISRQQSYPVRQWKYYQAAQRLWPGQLAHRPRGSRRRRRILGWPVRNHALGAPLVAGHPVAPSGLFPPWGLTFPRAGRQCNSHYLI